MSSHRLSLVNSLNPIRKRNRSPWFDTRLSYNPAIHRTKQALFHCAVVTDLDTNPLPPPHPELTKYFEPPKRVLRLAKPALEQCIELLKVKQGINLLSHSPPNPINSFRVSPQARCKSQKRRSRPRRRR